MAAMRPGYAGFARAALDACLAELDDTVTLGPERVCVLEAWPLPEDGFCVVYQHPYHQGLTVGFCARFKPAEEWGDDVQDAGFEIANFQISETLGSVEGQLRFDEDGVGWFGDLGSELPRKPG